jgi:hypothetical protein
MLLLAARLRFAGLRPKMFMYCVCFEDWQTCTNRLHSFIRKNCSQDGYIIIGHSLGGVLARAILPKLEIQPLALFLLASPTRACKAARRFAGLSLYRLMFGEMGQLLAQPRFMDNLPSPSVPTRIYAGIAGPTGRFSPFGEHANDGLLTLDETRLSDTPLLTLRWFHTYIMNASIVAHDIINARRLRRTT